MNQNLPKNSKVQIDYILIKKKWVNSALNCETLSSFEGVSSDHEIVSAKIRLVQYRNKKQTVKTTRHDWYSPIEILAIYIR